MFIVRFVTWLGVSIMMAGIFGFIAAVMVYNHYSQDLPSFEKLAEYSPPVVTRLYAGDGKLLAEYAKEKRIFMPLKAIPKRVQQAFVAAEDQSFYEHKGIDLFGIARAVRKNIINYGSGRSLVGGSTITQQVVKNFLLTSEKSIERKIKEAILAYRISQVYSKDQILELYLNEIYLGKGSYGVAAAALNYFNKSLDELTTEETALLAALPKAPATYNPQRNYEAALKRRNYVIGRMLDDGYIDGTEASRASAAPIQLEERSADEIAQADFFAEEIRRKLADMYGDDVLYEGGLTVKTTVDTDMQKMADEALIRALIDYDRRYGYRGPLTKLESIESWEVALPSATEKMNVPLYYGQQLAVVLGVTKDKATIGLPSGTRGVMPLSEMKWARKDLKGTRRGPEIKKVSDVLEVGDVIIAQPLEDQENTFSLKQVPQINGALVAMDPHTGRVLAMSGGYSYQGSEFNRATQAKRQPGSAFKPLVYLSALESGFTPSTVVMDQPIEISQGPGKPMWRPQNYGGKFLGPTTLRVGLEKSRNTMTVRMAQMVGLGRIINVAKRLGVYDGKVPRNYSMVLGAYETTLMKMVTAYSMIANGGRKVEASLIERIDDRDGEVIYRRDDRPCVGCQVNANRPIANATPPLIDDAREVVIDPRIAFQLTSMMEGVVKRGTAAKANKLKRPLAGKTGTTNDSRDAWFIGFSPDLVVGVYVGYDQPKSLGGRETGGKVALPGFIDFMKHATADQPARPFRMPQGVMMVQVDRNTGLPPYPGIEMSGKLIPEAFVTGGNIYRPPLPEDAEEEGVIQANYDAMEEVQEGYDPYAGWEDSQYYMSTEKAQWEDYRYYMKNQNQNSYQQQQPQQQYQQYQQQQQQPQTASPFPQGYNINARPPQNQRQQGGQTPYPNYNTSGGASYGTGALY